MKLSIGENIRRLRRERNVTQEELAEVFGVSCAAVSKWERSESYPDITLIFPLANYFSVSTDELMGYDLSRKEAEINALFQEHLSLFRSHQYEKAKELMRIARKEHPDDLRVMNQYMWDMAGSYADNDPAVLLAHKNEFFEICQKTIERCTDERIRLDAYNMLAKLLHAEGRTEDALAVYRTHFPDWYQTAGQKIEQLFTKDTPAFRDQLLFNQYELTDFAVNKKLKEIWFCREKTADEKTVASFALADALHMMADTVGEELYLAEYHVLNDLIGKFRTFSVNEDIKKQNLEKRASVALLCNTFADKEPIAREYLCHQYQKETL